MHPIGVTVISVILFVVLDRYIDSISKNIKDEEFAIRKKVEELRNGFCLAQSYQKLTQELLLKLKKEKKEIKESQADFALESAGGRVISTANTVSYIIHENSLSWMALIINSMGGSKEDARAILQPTVHPGECWAFRGDQGEVTIRLLGNVHVTGVTLEHIPPALSPSGDILSAPKEFSIKGLDSVDDVFGFNFGTFTYDKTGGSVQYFTVENISERPFELIKINFLNNWGNSEYTCVYRVQIHGRLAGSSR